MKLNPGLHGDSKMLDLSDPWIFAKESCAEEGSMRGMCGVGAQWEGKGQLSPVTLGMELQGSDFAMFSFHIAFI